MIKDLTKKETECVHGGIAVTVATVTTIAAGVATSVATGVVGYLLLHQADILKATFDSVEVTVGFINKLFKKKNQTEVAKPRKRS